MTSKNTYYLVGNVRAESQLATCGPAAAKKAGKDDPTPVPFYETAAGSIMYMPGSGFRSKLRGAICALILEAIERRGGKRFSLLDAQLNRVGGVKQKGKEVSIPTLAYQNMISSNPVMGLFGAAVPWIKGKAMIGHISCKSPNMTPMHIEGVRADIIKREPGFLDFMTDDAMGTYNTDIEKTKRYSGIKAEIRALESKAKAKSLSAEDRKKFKDAIADLQKKVADEGMHTVSAQQPLNGYLAIPPGSEMESKIALVGVTQIELGAFVAAMAKFSETPVLGAHVAHGAGIISGTWQIGKTGSGPIGSIAINPFVNLAIDGQELVDAKAAFDKFIESEACAPYADASILESVVDEPTEEGSDGKGSND
jgi:CRISPR type IV-associated protein Csf2